MKRALSFLAGILIAAGVFLPMAGAKVPTAGDLLRPYQAVLDRINREYAGLGPKIHIPSGSEKKVYDSIKGLSLPEFEKIMREEYLDALKYADPPENAEESYVLIPSGGSGPVVGKKSSAGGNADRTHKKSDDGKINPVDPIPNAGGKMEATPLG